MREEIIFIWKENGKECIKEIERKEFYNLMDSIKKSFSDDNEISSKLVEIIPNLVSITIDKERNIQLEVPFIVCNFGDATKIIEIKRYHKIIWAIFNKYCE